tara:strand:+ start:2623 stop:2853 length:231 start_codon:yes stop_codon:yes gene_type:complete
MSSKLRNLNLLSAATNRLHSALLPHPLPPIRISAGVGRSEEVDVPAISGEARGGLSHRFQTPARPEKVGRVAGRSR